MEFVEQVCVPVWHAALLLVTGGFGGDVLLCPWHVATMAASPPTLSREAAAPPPATVPSWEATAPHLQHAEVLERRRKKGVGEVEEGLIYFLWPSLAAEDGHRRLAD